VKPALEGGVEVGRVAQAVLHQVQVVVGVDRREAGAQQQRVAVADVDRLDRGEFVDGFACGIGHRSGAGLSRSTTVEPQVRGFRIQRMKSKVAAWSSASVASRSRAVAR
jgi:hypothetical protein